MAIENEKIERKRKVMKMNSSNELFKPVAGVIIFTAFFIFSTGVSSAQPISSRAVKDSGAPPAILDNTELQTTVNYLDYKTISESSLRFKYSDLPYRHMGHLWLMKKPLDLRGKTVRIDYRGLVPRQATFRIARSRTGAALVKKFKLEDSPYETRSILIEIPARGPFKDVRFLEFWLDRESAGRSYGDFVIESISEASLT